MGDGDAIAFLEKGEAAHAGGRGPGLDLALGVAGAHVFAARPGQRPVGAAGQRVDPAFFLREVFDLAGASTPR